MTRSPSVVVVGAGALGLCTAWHLTDRGVTDVTVIERDHVAGASSGLSVGIIETQYLDPLAIEIRVESMRFFTGLERSGALAITRNGYLRLGHQRRRHGGVRAERRGAADARRDRLSRPRAGRSAPAGPGHGRATTWPAACTARATGTSTVTCTATRSRPRSSPEAAASSRGPSSSAATRFPAIGIGFGRTAATSTATSWSTPRAAGPGASATSSARRSRSCRNGTRHSSRTWPRRSATSCRRSWTTCRRPAGSAPTSATTGPAGSSPGCTPRRSSTTSWIRMPSFVTPPTTTSSSSPNASRSACLAWPTCVSVTCGPASTRCGRMAGRWSARMSERASVVTVAGAGGSGLQSSPALGRIAADWILDGQRQVDSGRRLRSGPDPRANPPADAARHLSEARPRTIGPVDRGPARRYYSPDMQTA